MGPESVSLWLFILGILATVYLLVGGLYLWKPKQFLPRLIPVVAIFVIAIIANNYTDVANYIYGNLRYTIVFVAVVIIVATTLNIIRVIIKSDDLNDRRRHRKDGSRRSTPANKH